MSFGRLWLGPARLHELIALASKLSLCVFTAQPVLQPDQQAAQSPGQILRGCRPFNGVVGYVATKHAVNGLTKAVAKDAGPLGITGNAIYPGLVLTELVRRGDSKGLGLSGFDEVVACYSQDAALGWPVTPEEVAAVAVLLASDVASGITGGSSQSTAAWQATSR